MRVFRFVLTAFSTWILAAGHVAAADPSMKEVEFVTSPPNGSFGGTPLAPHTIRLESVKSSKGTLEPGDVVAVTGSYKLQQESNAHAPRLGAALIRPNKSKLRFGGLGPVRLDKKEGKFSLKFEIKEEGFLRLYLVSSCGRMHLGELHFGTAEQMKKLQDAAASR